MKPSKILRSLVKKAEENEIENKIVVTNGDLAKEFIDIYSRLDFSKLSMSERKQIVAQAKNLTTNLQSRSMLSLEMMRSNNVETLAKSFNTDMEILTRIKDDKIATYLMALHKIEERHGIESKIDQEDLDETQLASLMLDKAIIYNQIEDTIYKYNEKLIKFAENKILQSNGLSVNVFNLPPAQEETETPTVQATTIEASQVGDITDLL